MELTREEALRLHKQMWSDMKRDLGDTPDFYSRTLYKYRWCGMYGFADVMNGCFLCEYMQNLKLNCKYCPIKWPGGGCGHGGVTYCYSPISEILELPEREEVRKDV